ncbi:MAG: ParA family partition ATPase [Rhodospirillaceae bacterium]
MAGKIITIAQQKGGAGKTTLVAHLAVAWQQTGKRVALVDIDPQGSLTRWYEARMRSPESDGDMVLSKITGWRTQKEVERLARECDVVLIDSPPHAETEARIAVRAASIVVVPIQPSPMDFWATRPTLELCKQEKVKVLLVLNRMPTRSKVTETVVGEIKCLLMPPAVDLAEARVGNRTGYAGAMLAGRAVTETDKGSKGAEEMAALAAEIMGRI